MKFIKNLILTFLVFLAFASMHNAFFGPIYMPSWVMGIVATILLNRLTKILRL